MKKAIAALLLIVIAVAAVQPALAKSGRSTLHARALRTPTHSGPTRVHTYAKRNGRVVQGHVRTNANHTRSDNYSSKGNFNPYTGKPGAAHYNP